MSHGDDRLMRGACMISIWAEQENIAIVCPVPPWPMNKGDIRICNESICLAVVACDGASGRGKA